MPQASTLTLDQLQPLEQATITAIHSTGLNRRRMMDMGILPGTRIQVELRSPLGDPSAYLVRGAVIALRQKQAQEIEIQVHETA